MGETPTVTESGPPAEAGSFPEPSVNGGSANPHLAEGLVLDNVDWKSDELPPMPELLSAQAQPEGLGQVFEPTPVKHEQSSPAKEQAEESEKTYSSEDGWAVSGRNADRDELVLKRENPDFPSGYEVVRVKSSQYLEPAAPAIQPEARPAPAAGTEEPPADTVTKADAEEKDDKSDVLVDQQGNLWRHTGKTPSGMHRLESLSENHTKLLPDERMKEFANYQPDAEPLTAEAKAAEPAESELPAPDPEKEQMRQEIRQLHDRIARLESMLDVKESPYQIKPGGIIPVYSWAKGYESARILEEGERDGESFYKVVTAEGQTKTFFKDEVEYWFSHRAEPESVPKNPDEAKKRFSQKFQSIRQELSRLGGQAKTAAAEAAKAALEPIIDDAKIRTGYVAGTAKEALGVGIAMGHVWAENTAEASQNAAKKVGNMAKETVVYPWLTGQVVAEKAQENLPAYRRRLLGRAAGYAAVFSVWVLGPSELKPPAETEDSQEERVESPPLAA